MPAVAAVAVTKSDLLAQAAVMVEMVQLHQQQLQQTLAVAVVVRLIQLDSQQLQAARV
jgi:predicted protein tyrosine phosphatase